MVRIVKMTFAEGNREKFLAVYKEVEPFIQKMPGLQELKLYSLLDNKQVLFTLSRWEDASFLEAYRNSDLFKETWDKVKPLFSEPAQAYSLEDE